MLFQHTEDELTYRLLSQQYSTSEFTYENVVAEIDANRPFLMGFAAGGPYEGAHMTVCVGYEYGAGTQYVFVMSLTEAGLTWAKKKPFPSSFGRLPLGSQERAIP